DRPQDPASGAAPADWPRRRVNSCCESVPIALQYGSILEPNMGVNISIKNVPPEKVERLKLRAKRNHRSLQGELLAIIDSAVEAERTTMTLDELAEHARHIGLRTPSESVRMIREDRDRR